MSFLTSAWLFPQKEHIVRFEALAINRKEWDVAARTRSTDQKSYSIRGPCKSESEFKFSELQNSFQQTGGFQHAIERVISGYPDGLVTANPNGPGQTRRFAHFDVAIGVTYHPG